MASPAVATAEVDAGSASAGPSAHSGHPAAKGRVPPPPAVRSVLLLRQSVNRNGG